MRSAASRIRELDEDEAGGEEGEEDESGDRLTGIEGDWTVQLSIVARSRLLGTISAINREPITGASVQIQVLEALDLSAEPLLRRRQLFWY